MDWQTWHAQYDRPGSYMAQRLEAVRTQIGTSLDSSPPGPLRVVSLCAGQGRDLLPVLADHPRRDDVRALLVELDPRNAAYAEKTARSAGLDQTKVVRGDASLTDVYRGMVPADLVLVCGVFGNISDEDIERTVDSCARLCRTGGTVVWTRHRGAPDRVPLICEWFETRGFARQWLSDPAAEFGVGTHRFMGETQPLVPGMSMFTFTGYDTLRRSSAATDDA
ncbi:class I SAM-dependent methyltransferase [Streptomyces sp. NPDC001741]|uniref:class I SAM-dependent methyltransferase n=1 Tax=unclassified Streptomyces TaxID=2593676 RepID=UPI0036B0E5B7